MGLAARPLLAMVRSALGRARDASARAPQRVGGPHHDGESDPVRCRHARFERLAGFALKHGLADLGQQVVEELAVLRPPDGFQRRAQQPDVVFVQNARVREVDGKVEPRLATEGGQQSIRTLALDDALDDGYRQRLDVDGVGHVEVGHDRGRVRVHEDAAHALLAHGLAGLRPGVVELRPPAR